ncbi:uncharacterized protein F5147DRAFT_193479 [Suillus discolor]|uniref:DUF2423 domain-containing protein n=1 Tax=Suillus discolor TaxID=1912936 RepID=A0A9P7K028_9AGAM|nr:uncharacterized protein F5147DRAFT_193479 [Suillus discolor]KAG2118958.1 hypothetical protein F5147DRAFT_193479 [Suillus discolor]
MAKSTRSKVKRSFRAKKRDEGVYAATEAARLQRLNSKLMAKIDHGDEELAEPVDDDTAQDDSTAPDTMELDDSAKSSTTKPSHVSTHGARNSRREEWRKSKGMTPVPKVTRMNRQGLPAARRRSGRPSRRR